MSTPTCSKAVERSPDALGGGHRAPSSVDPFDDPKYLREASRRLRQIVRDISDPEVKRELAAQSLQLAQRAETILRAAEDPDVVRMNVARYRAILGSDGENRDKKVVERLLNEAEDALTDYHTLLALAGWYRDFAGRAGSPVLWEARLEIAEDLEREADRLERRARGPG